MRDTEALGKDRAELAMALVVGAAVIGSATTLVVAKSRAHSR